MQASEFMRRLEWVKDVNNWTWEETADAMELSRSMLHFIKKRKYPVSEKAVKRLRYLESQAGINPRAHAIIEAISQKARQAKPQVSPAEIEAGKTVVKGEFLSGAPPSGCDGQIRLSRPDIKARARLVADILLEQSYHPVLLACLPPELANDSFLNLLTPFSYNALAEAAMTLVFGSDWENGLPDAHTES
jgi:hypothetical protein